MSVQMHDLADQPSRHFHVGQQASTELVAKDRRRIQTNDRRLMLVLVLVEENMRRQLAVEDLATAVNLSPGRLAHLFKSEVGVSPHRYLNNLRLEKAKEFLENAALSVKEIATVVGIPNASQFCRSFKERYRQTPKEYRRTHLRIDAKSVNVCAASRSK